jgi:sugar phosphate isomerase/epimerase
MADRLAASTNSYHGYSLEEALAGIAAAGFKSVELASVPGWTEHLLRDADDAEVGRVKDLLAQHGLEPVSLSGHSDLVTDDGVAQFRKALRLCRAFGVGWSPPAPGGHDASSAAAWTSSGRRSWSGSARSPTRRPPTGSRSAWRRTAVSSPPARCRPS